MMLAAIAAGVVGLGLLGYLWWKKSHGGPTSVASGAVRPIGYARGYPASYQQPGYMQQQAPVYVNPYAQNIGYRGKGYAFAPEKSSKGADPELVRLFQAVRDAEGNLTEASRQGDSGQVLHCQQELASAQRAFNSKRLSMTN